MNEKKPSDGAPRVTEQERIRFLKSDCLRLLAALPSLSPPLHGELHRLLHQAWLRDKPHDLRPLHELHRFLEEHQRRPRLHSGGVF